jgi:MFS family permease
MPKAVSLVPAVGMLLAIPLYLYAYSRPSEELYTVARPLWCLGVFLHYSYLGSQYTIGQGVVQQRSRASAIALLLLLIALIGNSLGPQVVGWLSDMYMSLELKQAEFGGVLTGDLCRNAVELAKLPAEQQVVCRTAYAEGLRSSMMTTVLLIIPAVVFFYLSSRTLKRDMVA